MKFQRQRINHAEAMTNTQGRNNLLRLLYGATDEKLLAFTASELARMFKLSGRDAENVRLIEALLLARQDVVRRRMAEG